MLTSRRATATSATATAWLSANWNGAWRPRSAGSNARSRRSAPTSTGPSAPSMSSCAPSTTATSPSVCRSGEPALPASPTCASIPRERSGATRADDPTVVLGALDGQAEPRHRPADYRRPTYRARRPALRAAGRGMSRDGVLASRQPIGCLAHEPLGLLAVQPPPADQVDGGRACLGHDYADREVRGLLEHERRLSGGAERRLADDRAAGGVVEVLVERTHRFGEVAQRVGHRRWDVVVDGERAHRAAAQRLDAGQRRADLGGGLLVARELLARAAAERRQAQHLPPRRDGAVELGEAQAV